MCYLLIMSEIIVFSDGCCKGNPGPGGWGAVIQVGGVNTEIYGGEMDTTNNRMELRGAYESLAHPLVVGKNVTLVTDSRYLRSGILKWVHGWVQNGWTTQSGKPVANRDLWEAIVGCSNKSIVKWDWVKGHAASSGNNRADELANLGCSDVRSGKRANLPFIRATRPNFQIGSLF